MILAFLLLLTGLTLSCVAIYYSVIGLAAIFSAAVIPIYIMGSSLEVAKLVCASWLKANWDRVPKTMRAYMSVAVVVLMLITSMGIFGFLSKAHNDQNLVSGDVLSKIAIYDEKIKIEKENIEANRKALKQMDEGVDQVLGRSTDEKGADKAVAIRRSQQKERARLQAEIQKSQQSITELNDARAPIAAEVRKVEAEVGPIKYIAKFIYGENGASENMLEKAVTWVIILIVIVFDPLAVIMLLAAQMTYQWHKRGHDPLAEETPEDKYDHIVADVGSGPTVDQMIEQEEQQTNDLSEEEKELEPETTPPAYLNEPFVGFKDLQPMPAPHVEPEPKLETQPFDVVDNAPNWTLITENAVPLVDTTEVDRLTQELNEANSNVYELANYAQSLQQDYTSVSELHQRSMTREADLIEEVAELREQLKNIRDNQAAMSIVTPEEIPEVGVRDFTAEEVTALEEAAVPITEMPQEFRDFVKAGIEDGTLEVRGSYEPDDGALTTDQIEQIKQSSTQEDSASEASSAPITQPEPDLSVYDDERLVSKFDKQELAEEPKILTMGVDPVERPGDYITDPLENLLTRRDPKTGFGTAFPNDPERGDLFLRTDFRPNRLFKWNSVKWIEVNKNTTTAYTYNDAYIQYLAEQVMSGAYTWDDLTETEQEQVQTVIGGRRG